MIIGISGKTGSGKDTLAAILQYVDPERKWQVKKFAGKLKEAASLLTGVPIDKWEDQEFKNQLMPVIWGSMTYREFLQKFGTEAVRDHVHINTWCNALFAGYTPDQNWIITDVRFPDNEAKGIRDRGGFLIRMNRDGSPKLDHISETALDNYAGFYLTIDNNSTMETLVNMAVYIKHLMDTNLKEAA